MINQECDITKLLALQLSSVPVEHVALEIASVLGWTDDMDRKTRDIIAEEGEYIARRLELHHGAVPVARVQDLADRIRTATNPESHPERALCIQLLRRLRSAVTSPRGSLILCDDEFFLPIFRSSFGDTVSEHDLFLGFSQSPGGRALRADLGLSEFYFPSSIIHRILNKSHCFRFGRDVLLTLFEPVPSPYVRYTRYSRETWDEPLAWVEERVKRMSGSKVLWEFILWVVLLATIWVSLGPRRLEAKVGTCHCGK